MPMARSIWSGSISFGLVNIPVRLYTAVSQKEVHFHQLHEKDGARVQQKRFCSAEDKEIPWEEIAKGYEVSKGRYVMIEPEELTELDPKASRTVDITDFVDLEKIDPIYWQHTWYVAPDRGAAKAYALLLEAMKRTGKVAIARMVMRTKQYLCTLRPVGNALALSTMLYADELVDPAQIEGLPASRGEKPSGRELEMAEQLVGSLAAKWEPEKYHDDYRERVLAMIERKAEGKQIVTPAPDEERPAGVINLADALKASLAQSGGQHRYRENEPRAAARRGRTRRNHKKKAS